MWCELCGGLSFNGGVKVVNLEKGLVRIQLNIIVPNIPELGSDKDCFCLVKFV